jgi:ATP-dependent Clp protease ATP-binding subunit ClpC
MFERFTDLSRSVLVIAQQEALSLNHNAIGTEHLLLGLLRERDGVAAKALEELNISLADVRERIPEAADDGSTSTEPPFTSRVKKVLEFSVSEAMQLGHDLIGTEHILLGLIREGEGLGVKVLANLGVDPPIVRLRVIKVLSEYQEPEAARRDLGVVPTCPRCRTGLSASILYRRMTAVAEPSDSGTGSIWFEVVYCGQCGTALGILNGP